ncbi:MAG: PAS domain-containing protein [Actinomycetota bacterium]
MPEVPRSPESAFPPEPPEFDPRHHGLVDQIPAVTYVMPPGWPEHPCVYISPQLETLLGYSPEEWMDDAEIWLRALHPDDRERVVSVSRSVDETHEPWDMEYRLRRRGNDEVWVWVHDRATNLRDRSGTQMWHGVLIDITQRKHIQEALRASEDKYRTLVEQIPAVVYVTTNSPQPESMFLSPQVEQLTGYSVEELTSSEGEGGIYHRRILTEDLEKISGTWFEAVQEEQPFEWEYRFRRKDGRLVWLRDHSVPIPSVGKSPALRQGAIFDISEQKRHQDALYESDERYRTLVEQVPAIVYLVSNGEPPELVYVSPSVRTITGFDEEELRADPRLWLSRVPRDAFDATSERWTAAVQQQKPLEHEYPFLRKDGLRIWLKDRSVPLRDADGNVRYRQGITLDVSDRVRREQQLRESESMYRALVENIPAVVYIIAPDGDGSTLYVSPHVERLLGYTRDEWLDQPDIWMELLHPDDRERVLDAYDRANESGGVWSGEYRLIADDGRVVWFRDDATLVRDSAGNPQFWQGVRLDITVQKQAQEDLRTARDDLDVRVRERTAMLEEANEMMMLEIAERKSTEQQLRRAEEKYRGLVEQIPGAVAYLWEVDDSGTFTEAYTSPAIEHLLGYTVHEWHEGEFWRSRVHPDDYEAMKEATRRSERDGEAFDQEVRYLHKDGKVVWVHEKAALMERGPDGRPKLFNAVMLDITARKEVETRIRAAEDRHRVVLEQIPGAVAYVWETSDGKGSRSFDYTSPQISDVLGYTPAEWRSRSTFWTDRVHPDDRDRVWDATVRCEETGEPFAMEYRYLAKDGRVVWVRDQAVLVERSLEGAPWIFQGVFFDITERMQYERQIKDAEKRYRTLVEQLPAIVYVEAVDHTDSTASRIVFVSPQVEEVLGYSAEELITEPNHMQRIIHPDDYPGFLEEDRRSGRTGTPFSFEYRAIAKDGSTVWLHSRAALVRDEEGRPRFWHGLALDVTHLHPEPAPADSAGGAREIEGSDQA